MSDFVKFVTWVTVACFISLIVYCIGGIIYTANGLVKDGVLWGTVITSGLVMFILWMTEMFMDREDGDGRCE